VDHVEPEAGDIDRQQRGPGELGRKHEKGGNVDDAAVDEEGGKAAVEAKGEARLFQQSFPKENAGEEADNAETKHLPRCPRALAEEKVGEEDVTCNQN